jgi:hypothetical protein
MEAIKQASRKANTDEKSELLLVMAFESLNTHAVASGLKAHVVLFSL